MGLAGESHPDGSVLNDNSSLAPDKIPVNFKSVTLFETSKFLGQHTIEGVRHHGQQYIKVDLDQDRGRQGVQVKKFDRLGDDIFHPPASGIIADQEFYGGVKVIGDQEGRFLSAIATENDLADIFLVIAQRNPGLMDQRVGILPLFMRDMDFLPRLERLQFLNQLFPSASEGNKFDLLAVQLGKMVISGELGIKNQGGLKAPSGSFPEGKKLQDLIIGLIALNVRRGIQDQPGSGILGYESQGPFHPPASSPGPMFLEHRLFPVMGNGVKVEVNDSTVVQTQLGGFFNKGLLKTKQMDLIQRVRIGGQGRTFGQDIETGEQPQAGIESMIAHMGITLGSQQLQSQVRQEVINGRDDLSSGEPRLPDQLRNLELLQERRKKEDPGRLTVQSLAFQLPESNRGRSCRSCLTNNTRRNNQGSWSD